MSNKAKQPIKDKGVTIAAENNVHAKSPQCSKSGELSMHYESHGPQRKIKSLHSYVILDLLAIVIVSIYLIFIIMGIYIFSGIFFP